MGLFDPENEAEAKALATTIIAGMASSAIPQRDWSHTVDANGVLTERGRKHAAEITVGAFAIADAIVAEGEHRAARAAVSEILGTAVLADLPTAPPTAADLVDPLEMGEAELHEAETASADVPDITDLLADV